MCWVGVHMPTQTNWHVSHVIETDPCACVRIMRFGSGTQLHRYGQLSKLMG